MTHFGEFIKFFYSISKILEKLSKVENTDLLEVPTRLHF